MTSTLRIADDLRLPGDAVTETVGWVGNRGSGKTFGAKVAAEEMLRAGAQVVVLDPVDAWYGLRYGADKGASGLPIYVFGGAHGDAPLESTAGSLLADVVVEQGISAVFSLRHLPKTKQREFVRDFAERLYLRKGEDRYRTAVHVFIEEAHTFAPQVQGRGEDLRCLGAIQDLVLQGRGSGIGVSLITQRVAMLSKSVLELAEVLFAFRTTGPNARKALTDWFRAQDGDDHLAEFLAGITSLPRGEAWVWSPGYLSLFRRVKIRPATTFDSSATPTAGKARPVPRGTAAPLDLDALGDQIRDTLERAVDNDPRRLRARIAELERTIAAGVGRTVEVEVVREVPADIPAALLRLPGAVNEFFGTLTNTMGPLQLAVDAAIAVPSQMPATPPVRARVTPPAAARPTAPPRTPVPQAATDDVRLRAGARRIVDTLARHHPMRMTVKQLGTLAKFKTSGGTFKTYMGDIRRYGLLDEAGGLIGLSDAGVAYTGADVGGAMSVVEVRERWRKALRAGARTMLDVLIDRYPAAVAVDDLADAASLEASGGTFKTYLGDLTRNGLADRHAGEVRASDILFVGAA